MASKPIQHQSFTAINEPIEGEQRKKMESDGGLHYHT